MQRSETAIRTTHAGRLPPVGAGRPTVTGQVAEVIRKQVQLGISCVGDGEFWNGRNFRTTRSNSKASRRGRCGPANAARRGKRPASATRSRNSMPTWTASAPCSACPAKSRGFPADQNGRERSDQGPRDRSDPARDQCLQGGARGRRRRRGGFHLRVRAGLARSSHLRRVLRQRRGIRLRARRGAARGISRGGRCRLHPADRRSGRHDVMGHDQAGAEHCRIPPPSETSASMRSITRSPAFRRIACATTSAGAPGMARTPTTCRSRRSSISCSRCARKPAVSKPAMSVTSTNGRCGRTSSCPPARSSCRAWSATPPTWSSIPN